MKEIDIQFKDPALSSILTGRISIYLDMALWIDLVDSTSQHANRCRDELRRMVKEGVAFCPLSQTLLWELYKQEYDSALRMARLMEEFSLNVAFTPIDRIARREVDRFVYGIVLDSWTPLSIGDLFVPFIGYIAPGGRLTFPEGASEERQNFIVNMLGQRLGSLTAFIETMKETLPREYPMTRPELETRWKDNWEWAGHNRRRMNRIEEEHIAANVLLPRVQELVKNLNVADHARVAKALASLPRDRYGSGLQTMLQRLPTSRLQIAVAQAFGLDPNRKVTMNHFFDMEQLPVPLAYADVYATRDRGINHLLTKGGVLEKARPGIRYIAGLEELDSYLSSFELNVRN